MANQLSTATANSQNSFPGFRWTLDLEYLNLDSAILGVLYGLHCITDERANDQSRAPDAIHQNAQGAAWEESRFENTLLASAVSA